jgi:hypothetical protein
MGHSGLTKLTLLVSCIRPDPLPPILFNPGMFRRPLLWETGLSPEDVFHFREAAPTCSDAIAAEAPETASRILSKLSLFGPIKLCYGKRFAFNAADQSMGRCATPFACMIIKWSGTPVSSAQAIALNLQYPTSVLSSSCSTPQT